CAAAAAASAAVRRLGTARDAAATAADGYEQVTDAGVLPVAALGRCGGGGAYAAATDRYVVVAEREGHDAREHAATAAATAACVCAAAASPAASDDEVLGEADALGMEELPGGLRLVLVKSMELAFDVDQALNAAMYDG